MINLAAPKNPGGRVRRSNSEFASDVYSSMIRMGVR